jgi:hypothetical protein
MILSAPGYNRPIWQVTLDGQDLSGVIAPRLIELSVTECRTEELDQLTIEISDLDGKLAIPPRGAKLSVALGWERTGLIDKGQFVVDEVEHRGAPDTLSLTARSVDLLASMRVRKERSWHQQTVGQVLQAIASEHNLTASVGKDADTLIEHIDQTESDLAFVRRLGKRFDAVATVKSGHLLFVPAHEARTRSGVDIEPVAIVRAQGDDHRYHIADRDSYSGVRAYWHDPDRAKRRGVLVGQSGNAKRLRDTFASEEDALREARAEWQRIQRGLATFSYTLAKGMPQLAPQTPMRFPDMKPPINTNDWILHRVVHKLSDAGLISTLEMETLTAEAADETTDLDDEG